MTAVAAFALIFAINGFAADFRVFYLVRYKHGVHGKRADDPQAPYEVTISAPSASAVRRIVLQQCPNAVQIEIHRLSE
jgi:hypothetical protein